MLLRVGAEGGTIATSSTTVWVTCAAGLKLAVPDWFAAMMQLPSATIVTVVPETVQTAVLPELYETVRPELATASGLIGNVPVLTNVRGEACTPKVIVWLA